MLNRLAIFSFLVFSSVAIPMQSERNYQSRTVQSLDLESCVSSEDKMMITDDIINQSPEKNHLSNPNCKN